jgi:hypothetical protein
LLTLESHGMRSTSDKQAKRRNSDTKPPCSVDVRTCKSTFPAHRFADTRNHCCGRQVEGVLRLLLMTKHQCRLAHAGLRFQSAGRAATDALTPEGAVSTSSSPSKALPTCGETMRGTHTCGGVQKRTCGLQCAWCTLGVVGVRWWIDFRLLGDENLSTTLLGSRNPIGRFWAHGGPLSLGGGNPPHGLTCHHWASYNADVVREHEQSRLQRQRTDPTLVCRHAKVVVPLQKNPPDCHVLAQLAGHLIGLEAIIQS